MTDPRPRSLRLRAEFAIALAACLVCGSGCQLPGTRLSVAEEVELQRRASDLLARAAESELDVVRTNAIEAFVHVDPDGGRPHYRTALDSTNALVRYAGCVAIGEVRDGGAATALRKLVADADPRVRLAAAFALARCGDLDRGGPILMSALTDSPDERLRADAAYLIGKLDDPKALKALARAEGSEQSSYVTVHIETAMALLGDNRKLDKLIEYMLKSDSVTRLLALQALVELRDERARRALTYRLHDDSDYVQTRLLAARGLGRLGSNEGYRLAYAHLRFADRGDANEQMRVRSNAALALGAIGDRKALAALRDMASGDSDERVQVAAAMAILQIMQSERTQ